MLFRAAQHKKLILNVVFYLAKYLPVEGYANILQDVEEGQLSAQHKDDREDSDGAKSVHNFLRFHSFAYDHPKGEKSPLNVKISMLFPIQVITSAK
jgi:hypothetical protein